MDAVTKLPKKHMYIILFGVSILILSLSLDTMMKVKDLALYDAWYNEMIMEDMSYNDAFSVYVTGNIAVYFLRVIVPMALGIHTYFAYSKIRINKLFVFIWTVLLVGNTAYMYVSKEFDSIFYWMNIGLHGLLTITVLSLTDVINKIKMK